MLEGWTLLKLFNLTHRAYRRKCSARLNSHQFQCGSPALETRSIISPSSGFTYCKSATSDSDLTDNLFLLLLKIEG